MVMTKKASFGALLYRELLIVRSGVMINLISFGIMALSALLVIMSMKFGNLSKMTQVINSENYILLFAEILPVVAASGLTVSAAESSVRDEMPLWKRFRKSCPVKPQRFSLAKTAVLFLCAAVSVAFGFASSLLIRLVNGSSFTAEDAGLILLINAVLTVISVVFAIYMMLLHSADKAGIALTGTVMAVFFPYSIATGLENARNPSRGSTSTFDKLLDFAEDFIPFSVLIILGVTVIGFFAFSALIKRGER